MSTLWLSLPLLLYVGLGVAEDPLVLLVLSQSSEWHAAAASRIRDSIHQQASTVHANVVVEVWPGEVGVSSGGWTVAPLLPPIRHKHPSLRALVVLETESVVRLALLLEVVNERKSDESWMLGYGLIDKSPSIIHHFYGFDGSSSTPFEYPDFGAGVVLSRGLIECLVSHSRNLPLSGFSIDAKHELARRCMDGCSTRLSSLPHMFCLQPAPACAVALALSPSTSPFPVSRHSIFTAIKTFSGFHKTRVVVAKRTWVSGMRYAEFFSDEVDEYIPTKHLGVPNTERGHCGKTLAILEHFLHHAEMTALGVDWLLVADDDTLLSPPRLYRLLSRFDPRDSVIVGERYGYGFSWSGDTGYDYPTGGSGMVFSRVAVERLVAECKCPTDDSPDDMVIGMCARSLRIPVVHSCGMHQARSVDYSSDYLARQPAISLHKHDDVDPYAEYVKYLHEEDEEGERDGRHGEL